jgi:hypothetical protein
MLKGIELPMKIWMNVGWGSNHCFFAYVKVAKKKSSYDGKSTAHRDGHAKV